MASSIQEYIDSKATHPRIKESSSKQPRKRVLPAGKAPTVIHLGPSEPLLYTRLGSCIYDSVPAVDSICARANPDQLYLPVSSWHVPAPLNDETRTNQGGNNQPVKKEKYRGRRSLSAVAQGGPVNIVKDAADYHVQTHILTGYGHGRSQSAKQNTLFSALLGKEGMENLLRIQSDSGNSVNYQDAEELVKRAVDAGVINDPTQDKKPRMLDLKSSTLRISLCIHGPHKPRLVRKGGLSSFRGNTLFAEPVLQQVVLTLYVGDPRAEEVYMADAENWQSMPMQSSNRAVYFEQLVNPFNASSIGPLTVPDQDCRPAKSKVLRAPYDHVLTQTALAIHCNPNAPLQNAITLFGYLPANSYWGAPAGYYPIKTLAWSDALEDNYVMSRVVSMGLELRAGTISTAAVNLSGTISHGRLSMCPPISTIDPNVMADLITQGDTLQRTELFRGLRIIAGGPESTSYMETTSGSRADLGAQYPTKGSTNASIFPLAKQRSYPLSSPNSVLTDGSINLVAGVPVTIASFSADRTFCTNYQGAFRVRISVMYEKSGGADGNIAIYLHRGKFTPVAAGFGNVDEAQLIYFRNSGSSAQAFVDGVYEYLPSTQFMNVTWPTSDLTNTTFWLTIESSANTNIVGKINNSMSVEFISDKDGTYSFGNTVALITGYSAAANQQLSFMGVANLEAVPNLQLMRQTTDTALSSRTDLEEFSLSKALFYSLAQRSPGFSYTYPLDSPVEVASPISKNDVREAAMADWKNVFRGIGKTIFKNRRLIPELIEGVATRNPSSVLTTLSRVRMADEPVDIDEIEQRLSCRRPRDNQNLVVSMTDDPSEAMKRMSKLLSSASPVAPIETAPRPQKDEVIVKGLLELKQPSLRGYHRLGKLDLENFLDPDTYTINYGVAVVGGAGTLLAVVGSHKPVSFEHYESDIEYRKVSVSIRSSEGLFQTSILANNFAFPGMSDISPPVALIGTANEFYKYLTIMPFVDGGKIVAGKGKVPTFFGDIKPVGQSATCLAYLTMKGMRIRNLVTGGVEQNGVLASAGELAEKLGASLSVGRVLIANPNLNDDMAAAFVTFNAVTMATPPKIYGAQASTIGQVVAMDLFLLSLSVKGEKIANEAQIVAGIVKEEKAEELYALIDAEWDAKDADGAPKRPQLFGKRDDFKNIVSDLQNAIQAIKQESGYAQIINQIDKDNPSDPKGQHNIQRFDDMRSVFQYDFPEYKVPGNIAQFKAILLKGIRAGLNEDMDNVLSAALKATQMLPVNKPEVRKKKVAGESVREKYLREQVAQRKGKVKEELVRKSKTLFDILGESRGE